MSGDYPSGRGYVAPMRGKVVVLHEALRAGAVPHAFGGALALAYYAEPRPTADIDLNLFVPPERWPEVRETLPPLGLDAAAASPDGDELRLPWDGLELHLFFASDNLHEAMAGATREVPLGGAVVPIVSPEHLVVRKAILDREKDWADIEAILTSTDSVDLSQVHAWLARLLGPRDPRLTRFTGLAFPDSP